MATTTRRRKATPPDAPGVDLIDLADAGHSEASASPEPAAEPASEPTAQPARAKPARLPRRTSAAPRGRRPAPADVPAEAAETPESGELAAEPALESAPELAFEPAPALAPRPRRRRATADPASADMPADLLSEPAAPYAETAPAADATSAAGEAELPLLGDEPATLPDRIADEPAEAEPARRPEAAEWDDEPSEADRANEADDSEDSAADQRRPHRGQPRQPARPAEPIPENSRLSLDDGLARRLRWRAGSRCPDTLAQAVRRWEERGSDAGLRMTGLDDLAELLAIADRVGHRLEVDPGVWTQLARLGDLQGRIAHLEAQYPHGLDPAAQPEDGLLAGWRACQLEAAFFAACVGRCVLADEPALRPEDELLLAARLVMQHFGTGAPVVRAMADAHPGWQSAWERVWPTEPPDQRPALQLLAPGDDLPPGAELLLLDQRGGLQPEWAEAAQEAPWMWVLAPADLLERPEAPPLLAAVDQLRQGGLAAWQAEGDADALAPLLLARRFAEVAAQWPAWAPAVRTTPASADEASSRADLAQRLARWQRSGFLADSDQLALRRAVQALWAAARDANAAALPGLLQEALAAGAGSVVVFTEDAAALPGLADALQAAGLPAVALPSAGSPRLADQALRAFREASGPRILLAADGPQGAEPRIGVQLTAPLVIHLDTPWAPGALARRLHRVRPGAAQREVPVWQLLPEGCLMARRAETLPEPDTAPPTRLDGALLRGAALDAWRAELAAIL
jgi:hypothetical protein